jgi:hypothetical protein
MYRLMMYLLLAEALVGCDSTSQPATSPSDPTQGPEFSAGGLPADGPGIDRSLFQPQLSSNLDWGCRWVSDNSQILCTANGKDIERTDGWQPTDVCPDGNIIYENGSRSLIAKRFYNSDYKLVEKVLHWFGAGKISLHPDGSGKTASGTGSAMELWEYSIPGNTGEGVTVTIQGTDAKFVTDQPPHEVLVLDKGELIYDPNGDEFTIVTGRWDIFTEFDAVIARECEALR